MKRLLAATDLSARSERALRRAAILARDFRAELVLLHAVDDDQPAPLAEAAQRQADALLRAGVAAMSAFVGLMVLGTGALRSRQARQAALAG